MRINISNVSCIVTALKSLAVPLRNVHCCLLNRRNEKTFLNPYRYALLHLSANRYNDNLNEESSLDSASDEIINDDKHENFTRLLYSIPGYGHRIYLIQPYLKRGSTRLSKAEASLKMVEANALVETLNNWKIEDKVLVPSQNLNSKHIFGAGNVEMLQDLISRHRNISAVFINLNKLTGLQFGELSALFGVPVYDRYSIILQIFKENARSRVSKLQIAVAEIPYLRSRLTWYQKGGRNTNFVSGLQNFGGAGEIDINLRKELLEKRELKLKEVVEKLKRHRQLLRHRRKRLQLPTVAVVGYTNAGKTSLIKSLTGDQSMQPVNHLFATLDVTVHGAHLPSRMQIGYVDTVGFISDVPTALIESFQSTLEDAIYADLIIHIRDLSHPDTVAQKACVLETLKSLNLSQELMDNIVEVGNKIDLVSNKEELESMKDGLMLISATNGDGLAELQLEVERRMFNVRDINMVTFRVPNGGDAYRLLYKLGAVKEVNQDEDENYLQMVVVIDDAMLSKFRSNYPDVEFFRDSDEQK